MNSAFAHIAYLSFYVSHDGKLRLRLFVGAVDKGSALLKVEAVAGREDVDADAADGAVHGARPRRGWCG